jgi:hypothetical protein
VPSGSSISCQSIGIFFCAYLLEEDNEKVIGWFLQNKRSLFSEIAFAVGYGILILQ